MLRDMAVYGGVEARQLRAEEHLGEVEYSDDGDDHYEYRDDELADLLYYQELEINGDLSIEKTGRRGFYKRLVKQGYIGLLQLYQEQGRGRFTETEYEQGKASVIWNERKARDFGFSKTINPAMIYARGQLNVSELREVKNPDGKLKYPLFSSIEKFLLTHKAEVTRLLYEQLPLLYKESATKNTFHEKVNLNTVYFNPHDPNFVISVGNVSWRTLSKLKTVILNHVNMANNKNSAGNVHSMQMKCLEPAGYYGKGGTRLERTPNNRIARPVTRSHDPSRDVAGRTAGSGNKSQGHSKKEAKHANRVEAGLKKEVAKVITMANPNSAVIKNPPRKKSSGPEFSSDIAGDGPVSSLYEMAVTTIMALFFQGFGDFKDVLDMKAQYTLPRESRRSEVYRQLVLPAIRGLKRNTAYTVRYACTYTQASTRYNRASQEYTACYLYKIEIVLANGAIIATIPTQHVVMHDVTDYEYSWFRVNASNDDCDSGKAPGQAWRQKNDYSYARRSHVHLAAIQDLRELPHEFRTIRTYAAAPTCLFGPGCTPVVVEQINGNNGSWTNSDDVPAQGMADRPSVTWCRIAFDAIAVHVPAKSAVSTAHSTYVQSNTRDAAHRLRIKEAKEKGKIPKPKVSECDAPLNPDDSCDCCLQKSGVPVQRALGNQTNIVVTPSYLCQRHFGAKHACPVAKHFAPYEFCIEARHDTGPGNYADRPPRVIEDASDIEGRTNREIAGLLNQQIKAGYVCNGVDHDDVSFHREIESKKTLRKKRKAEKTASAALAADEAANAKKIADEKIEAAKPGYNAPVLSTSCNDTVSPLIALFAEEDTPNLREESMGFNPQPGNAEIDSDSTVSDLTDEAVPADDSSVISFEEVVFTKEEEVPKSLERVVMLEKYGVSLQPGRGDHPAVAVCWVRVDAGCARYSALLPDGDYSKLMPTVRVAETGYVTDGQTMLATKSATHAAALATSMIASDILPKELRSHYFFNNLKVWISQKAAEYHDMTHVNTNEKLSANSFGIGRKMMMDKVVYVKFIVDDLSTKVINGTITNAHAAYLMFITRMELDRLFGHKQGPRSYPPELFLGTYLKLCFTALDARAQCLGMVPEFARLAQTNSYTGLGAGITMAHPAQKEVNLDSTCGGAFNEKDYVKGQVTPRPINAAPMFFLKEERNGKMRLDEAFLTSAPDEKLYVIRQPNQGPQYNGTTVDPDGYGAYLDAHVEVKNYESVASFAHSGVIQDVNSLQLIPALLRNTKATPDEQDRRKRQQETMLGALFYVNVLMSLSEMDPEQNEFIPHMYSRIFQELDPRSRSSKLLTQLMDNYDDFYFFGESDEETQVEYWKTMIRPTLANTRNYCTMLHVTGSDFNLQHRLQATFIHARACMNAAFLKHVAFHKPESLASIQVTRTRSPFLTEAYKAVNKAYYYLLGGPKLEQRVEDIDGYTPESVTDKDRLVTLQLKPFEYAKEKVKGEQRYAQHARTVMSFTPIGFILQNPASMYYLKFALAVNIHVRLQSYTAGHTYPSRDRPANRDDGFYSATSLDGHLHYNAGDELYYFEVKYESLDPSLSAIYDGIWRQSGPVFLMPDTNPAKVHKNPVASSVLLGDTEGEKLLPRMQKAKDQSKTELTTTCLCYSDDSVIVGPASTLEADIEANDGSHSFYTMCVCLASTPLCLGNVCTLAYGATAWPVAIKPVKNGPGDLEYNRRAKPIILGFKSGCNLFSGAITTSVANSIINLFLTTSLVHDIPASSSGFSVAITSDKRLADAILLSQVFYTPGDQQRFGPIALEKHPGCFFRTWGSRAGSTFKRKNKVDHDIIVQSLWADVVGVYTYSRASWTHAFHKRFRELYKPSTSLVTRLTNACALVSSTKFDNTQDDAADVALCRIIARGPWSYVEVFTTYQDFVRTIETAPALIYVEITHPFIAMALHSRYAYAEMARL